MRTSSVENVLARVLKLIAMTTSPYREEARNAAETACRLIREHGLTVVEGAAIEVAKAPPPREASARRRPIHARMKGLCCQCGDRVSPGDKVWWARDQGTQCGACRYVEMNS